jgi:hypothetical protein
MEIKDIFSHLISAASQPDTDEDSIYESLEAAEVPFNQADRIYKFVQIAWGRAFLDGMGITFTNDYFCFNANGEVIESGQLNEEPHFAYAMNNVKQYKGTEVFNKFALSSSDVNAINDALNSGSQPEDLLTSPSFLFMEAPTDSGFEKAQIFINNHMKSLQPKIEIKQKPWWKFWG